MLKTVLSSLQYVKSLFDLRFGGFVFCFCFVFTFFLFFTKTYAISNTQEFCLKMPVLYYHHIEPVLISKTERRLSLAVSPEVFTNQMQYLADRGYQTIFAEDLVSAIMRKTTLPEKTIVITIDDGYADAYDYAFPIAKNYGVKLNLMISTGLVENKGHLSWSQIKTMVGSGLIHVYNHTWSHAELTKSNEPKITMEIMTAKQQLEDHVGTIFPLLIYPYGAYNTTVVNIARAVGVLAGFSTKKGFLQCDSFIMNLHRIGIDNVSLARYGL